ncbi:MAG: ANTAR domain-containing protein [Microthrixaceae bacterium]
MRWCANTAPTSALLDIKMPGMDGISAAREIAADRLTAVVLVTAFSQRELIEEASDAGVQGYVVKPFERHDLTPAIEVAIARFRSEKALAEQVTDVEERLETRKVLDRAKGVLMDRDGLREQDAFGFLQKTAMTSRRPMRAVADDVLSGSLRPEQP